MNNTTDKPSASKIGVERGQEHVLVVEDDDMVREHVVRQLDSLGYRVSKASGGPTGLEIIRERADIDLLFTDVVLSGGMTGEDLAEEAVRLRPELRILLTSGYSDHRALHGDGQGRWFQLLQKPYGRKELARRLRIILEGG